MVLDRSPADEEAIADLAIGQAVTEQVEHLDFPLAQELSRPSTRGRL
jgi:hypothetical protein